MLTSEVQRLRVRIGEYEALDPAEKVVFILDQLDTETRARWKQGVSRFKTLLGVFGLSGRWMMIPEGICSL